jgi:hypothetical protein
MSCSCRHVIGIMHPHALLKDNSRVCLGVSGMSATSMPECIYSVYLFTGMSKIPTSAIKNNCDMCVPACSSVRERVFVSTTLHHPCPWMRADTVR